MVTALDKNTALVLIDLQKGIVSFPTAHPVEGVIENSASLVAAFREANLPVVIVNVRPSGGWLSSRKDAQMGGSGPLPEEFFEIIPQINAQEGDIFITKSTWSAFHDTALDEELKKRDVTGLVIGGVATSIGVEGTARAASERGYNITFAKDAMTDMVADAHENSLQHIFPRMGEVDDTKNIIAELGKR